jgi:hypothetical protein
LSKAYIAHVHSSTLIAAQPERLIAKMAKPIFFILRKLKNKIKKTQKIKKF